MSRRRLQQGGMDYLVDEDDSLSADRRWWAVMRARVIDEITGEPPRAPLTLRTSTARCTPRVDGDGNCGLVARPADVAAALTTPGALTAEIQAQGYLPRSLTADIDAARRRLSPGGASAGDTLLRITPGDPVSPPPAQRAQFRPGRGVMVARPTPPAIPPQPEEFTTVPLPLTAPAASEVPLSNPLRVARLVNTRVAGVPLVLPDQPLHRAPVAAIGGRVMRQSAPGASAVAAPAAQIEVVGVWWSQPEVRTNSAPPHPPNLVSLNNGIAFAHAAGVAVEHCTLTPDLSSRELAVAVYRDAREIQLQNWSALNVAGGDVLQLEANNSNERELVVLDAFTPPTLPENPARIGLRSPVAFAHAAGTEATLVSVTPVSSRALEREAQPGDRVLFAVNFTGVPAQAVLRIAGGTSAEELCFASRVPTRIGGTLEFPVTIRADGAFVFPALARVAQLRLRTVHAGQTTELIDLALEFGGDSPLEILLKP